MTKQRLISTVLLAAMLSSCSMIPAYNRPDMDVPANWSQVNASEPTKIAKDWWKNFGSDELNGLMETALVSNYDIGAAIQRVEQSRATLQSTRSSLLPSVDASGDVSYDNVKNRNSKTHNDDVGGSAGLNVSYELDLFGKNRAGVIADEAALQSSQYARDAIALIVMGDVAETYFNVLNYQERLRIADENLASAHDLLRIVQARYDAGATSLLDVAQQKSDLASSEASRAAIERDSKIALTALAVLVGKAPQNFNVAQKDLRNLPVPVIAPAQPSSLLERRPDIRQSESDLVAANANIGAARAAFFPSINLGAGLSIAATPLGDPVTTAMSLGSSLLAPIFSGGLLEGNLAFTKARKLELVENYRKTILTSFKEVEDAMTTVNSAQLRETSLETAMNEARKAYDLSQQQYDAGAIDFQILLDAKRTRLQAEDTYIQTKNERLTAAVDLFKALGGGWYEDQAPVAATAPAKAVPATVATPPVSLPKTPATSVPEATAPAPAVNTPAPLEPQKTTAPVSPGAV